MERNGIRAARRRAAGNPMPARPIVWSHSSGHARFYRSGRTTGSRHTVQGYISVAIGAVMTGAMGFSGVLYGHFGGLAYGAMAIIAFAGGLLALTAHRNFETIIDRADTSKPAHGRRETSFAD